jgi:hypothetical protein
MTDWNQKKGRWMKLTPFRQTYLLQYRIWLTRQVAEHEKTYYGLLSTVKNSTQGAACHFWQGSET